ncbi:MAG: NAD(P)/FAD-dependent oxidoreductase [Bacteroidota bacterium]|nr:NAD(P)/FAD-dependent oxidoreductase [Bacteroidota bacterium]
MADMREDFDAIVVGSGPNGLAAAITLQQKGLSVLITEAKSSIGGGMRSLPLTLPGYIHDVCSAIHPLGASSPFFTSLPLQKFGLDYIYPSIAAAHPFDDGTAAKLVSSITATAQSLSTDSAFYCGLMNPLLRDWQLIVNFILGPLGIPKHPIAVSKFGYYGLASAKKFANHHLHTVHGRGLWAGMASHSMQPLTNAATSAMALVLLLLGHNKGWPVARGGSQSIADAMVKYFISIGGKIETNFEVTTLQQLPSSRAILFDVTPQQLLNIAGHKLSSFYRWQLKRFRYGMGVYKIDWALDAQTPFKAIECRSAGTVHLGNTLEEIAYTENISAKGKHPDKPFVLFAQPSVFDKSRAPASKHTAWAYCHVPKGSSKNMTENIEKQVERFAPGFRERILARHVMDTQELEAYNSNYIGGDINGGVQDIAQLFTRPALRLSPYRTSKKGIYICSSSTPPGGGVHGMAGYHAAERAYKDIFKGRIV